MRTFKKGDYELIAYGKSSVSLTLKGKEVFHTGFYNGDIEKMDIEKELDSIVEFVGELRKGE